MTEGDKAKRWGSLRANWRAIKPHGRVAWTLERLHLSQKQRAAMTGRTLFQVVEFERRHGIRK